MKEIVLFLGGCPGESLSRILTSWLTGWLAGRLAGYGWLAGWPASCLAGEPAGRPAGAKTLYFLCFIGVFAKNVVKLMLFDTFLNRVNFPLTIVVPNNI